MKWRISIQCTRCGACVAICPDGAIHRRGKRYEIKPALCHSCNRLAEPFCLIHCPAGAIRPAAPVAGRRSSAPR